MSFCDQKYQWILNNNINKDKSYTFLSVSIQILTKELFVLLSVEY